MTTDELKALRELAVKANLAVYFPLLIKLLDLIAKQREVIDAAEKLWEWLPCGPSVKADEIAAWSELGEKLDALRERDK
jgi:hypothetical protein